jgi:hypothetical protein
MHKPSCHRFGRIRDAKLESGLSRSMLYALAAEYRRFRGSTRELLWQAEAQLVVGRSCLPALPSAACSGSALPYAAAHGATEKAL